MRIFVVCFGDLGGSPIADVVHDNPHVEFETEDGGRAYSRVAKLVPDVVLFDGDQKPSHVLQTLQAMAKVKKLSATRFVIAVSAENEERYRVLTAPRITVVKPTGLSRVLGTIGGSTAGGQPD